jgi:hypothetical protein
VERPKQPGMTYGRPLTRPKEEQIVTQLLVNSGAHTLPGNGPKYSGNQEDAPRVITELVLMHIEDCIRAVAPGFAEAFKGRTHSQDFASKAELVGRGHKHNDGPPKQEWHTEGP